MNYDQRRVKTSTREDDCGEEAQMASHSSNCDCIFLHPSTPERCLMLSGHSLRSKGAFTPTIKGKSRCWKQKPSIPVVEKKACMAGGLGVGSWPPASPHSGVKKAPGQPFQSQYQMLDLSSVINKVTAHNKFHVGRLLKEGSGDTEAASGQRKTKWRGRGGGIGSLPDMWHMCRRKTCNTNRFCNVSPLDQYS